MKATPKTDEVIDVLKQAVTVINLIEYNLREIERTDSKADEAKGVINAYKSNLDYCHSCKVTAKDVYDEYWEICPSVESLPKCAKALAVRFENVGIPVWVCDPYSSYKKQINEKIWNMEKQRIITKKQASDLMCLFDLLAKWVMVWVFRVQNILKEMGVEPLPLQTDKPEETGDKARGREKKPHYNKDDETKARGQFERLVSGGYFTSETSLNDWLYIYGVKDKEPNKKPLDWQKTQKELGYMVRSIWQNTDTKIWAVCSEVFTIKGKKPNTDVIKSDLSSIDNGYKNRPETFDNLDEVLRG